MSGYRYRILIHGRPISVYKYYYVWHLVITDTVLYGYVSCIGQLRLLNSIDDILAAVDTFTSLVVSFRCDPRVCLSATQTTRAGAVQEHVVSPWVTVPSLSPVWAVFITVLPANKQHYSLRLIVDQRTYQFTIILSWENSIVYTAVLSSVKQHCSLWFCSQIIATVASLPRWFELYVHQGLVLVLPFFYTLVPDNVMSLDRPSISHSTVDSKINHRYCRCPSHFSPCRHIFKIISELLADDLLGYNKAIIIKIII